jgi:hypothetical protein
MKLAHFEKSNKFRTKKFEPEFQYHHQYFHTYDSVLFIGTRFSNLYTAVYPPAETA